MNNWSVIENQYTPEEMPYKETIFTIGNGYVGTRGTFEEAYPGQQAVTLVHGVFDDVPIVHTELVNVPDMFNMELIVGNDRFSLHQGKILEYERVLDLQTGTLSRRVLWETSQGHKLSLSFKRFASLADQHVLVLRCVIKAVDYAGHLHIRSGLSGFVDNAGFVHWHLLGQGTRAQQEMYLSVKTRNTDIVVSEAASLDISAPQPVTYKVWDVNWSPQICADVTCNRGDEIVIDKYVTLVTSLDTEDPQAAALAKLQTIKSSGYEKLKSANDAIWKNIWDQCNIVIDGDDEMDLAIRFSVYQLLIAAPRWSDRTSIPAKTLSGYGYRGHVFWDTEIFMLPFFIYTQPDLAKNMLMYRYHTLPGARRKARHNGYEGAMYAWESAGTGDETTPRWVPVWIKDSGEDELVRIWCGDIELHITSDIAYGLIQYWRITGDDAFMCQYGAEILLETARFWGSRVEYYPEMKRFEIHDVIGPDENHEHVDNNAYTNAMVRWHLRSAIDIVGWLSEVDEPRLAQLADKIGMTDAMISHWQVVADALTIGLDEDTGLIEQFDGFFKLKDIDWKSYEPRSTSMQALLGIEETQKYQILKQPDVMMLLYLLPDAFSHDILKTNWEYYTPRTDHAYGSSLGPAVQAIGATRLGDLGAAYADLRQAARTDLTNNRRNTADGIHGATAGGLWQAIVLGFAGIEATAEGLTAKPRLPKHWRSLQFKLCWHGKWYDFNLQNES